MLNIGIIGPGRVAEKHANAIKEIPHAQLWSVCGRTIQSAEQFAKKHNAVALDNTFSDATQMLADPKLDAVIIATPDKLHAKQIEQAIKFGKSILVEKPVCTSLSESQALLELYQQSKITLAIGYHLRWHRGLNKVAEKLHQNEFGEIRHVRLHWAVDFQHHGKWRTDPEKGAWFCLSTLGTHLLDNLRWFLVPTCGEIVEIKSIVKNLPYSHADGTVLAMLRFESGATAEFYCSVQYDSPFNMEIYASRKNIAGMDLTGDPKNRKIWIGDEPLLFDTKNCYVDQLKDFCRCVTAKKEPAVSLAEGLKNVENLIAIAINK